MTISENEYSGSFGHYFQHYLPDNRFGDIENILEKRGFSGKIISYSEAVSKGVEQLRHM
ncbi:hypothetical protein [Sphingobium sp. GW456-12-10-14-TSB1]|uniref:hypothetical protein n=1 Tax=Sphingobium sp. GW456-12-10-14-TSB1 TaxID=1987165 RepID=UPI00159446D5|nr:hypothetical protein [Sphingobium sp. GW456-12-10-14-TSB1]